MIEVTSMDSGKTKQMTKREFFKHFGKDMGAGILSGEWPHIVAVEI